MLMLTGISEGEWDKVLLSISLRGAGVIWGGDVAFQCGDCPMWISSLLVGEWRYWGVLGSGSGLLLEGSWVPAAGVLCWRSGC